ncbi:MAG: S8 family serine peptidase [Bacteroidota bacterium]
MNRLVFLLLSIVYLNDLFAQPINDECATAIALTVNVETCGGITHRSTTFQATPSALPKIISPDCEPTGAVQDIWFTVIVPVGVQNLIIRKRANTNIKATIEAYTKNTTICDNVSPIGCYRLNEAPNGLILENVVAGEEILLRVWGKNEQDVGDDIELSAHELPDDLSRAWIICDETTGEGSGRVAHQLIVSYYPNVPPDPNLFNDPSLMPVKTCECGPNALQLWEFDSEIELETRRQAAAQQMAKVDNTDYNYNINDKTTVVYTGTGGASGLPSTLPGSMTDIVRVGVVDAGINENHFVFQGGLWTNNEASDGDNCVLGDQGEVGFNFRDVAGGAPVDIDGHGTWVSSVVLPANSEPVQFEILSAQFHKNGDGSLFDAICSIYYAVAEGVEVLNLSWGFWSNEFPKVLQDALRYAECEGVTVICSAGNEAENNENGLGDFKLPANAPLSNIITVAAYYNINGTPTFATEYSNFGQTSVDLVANGGSFVARHDDNSGIIRQDGTSIAAPQVTRTTALIKAQHPELSPQEIKACILDNVTVVPAWNNLMTSSGFLNQPAALTCADNISPNKLRVKVKAFLEGAMDENATFPKMRSFYGDNNLLPQQEPLGTGNNETIAADFDETLDIVDWVEVTIRGVSMNGIVQQTQAALLTADGTVVNTNGSSTLIFENVPPNLDYQVQIRARHHLKVSLD